MLYISTSEWVLHTAFAVPQMLFFSFLPFLQYFASKKVENVKLENAGSRPNPGLAHFEIPTIL